MYLRGWKYEGRKISDKLHEQILSIVDILNDPYKVGDRNWPELQKYISDELGIATGQVRTIKRMMEEFDIVKRGALNASSVPVASEVFSDNGKTLIELIATENLMSKNLTSDNVAAIKEIKEIYKLYYQKTLTGYKLIEDGNVLHPLRATLKALNEFGHLNYWEWYLLNTIIRKDNDTKAEQELRDCISRYRQGALAFSDSDIIENQLSHSYVLGNFEYAGFVTVEGSKTRLKIKTNRDAEEIILEIIKED